MLDGQLNILGVAPLATFAAIHGLLDPVRAAGHGRHGMVAGERREAAEVPPASHAV